MKYNKIFFNANLDPQKFIMTYNHLEVINDTGGNIEIKLGSQVIGIVEPLSSKTFYDVILIDEKNEKPIPSFEIYFYSDFPNSYIHVLNFGDKVK